MTVPTVPRSSATQARRVPFRALLHSELGKLGSQRSLRLLAVLAVSAAPVTALVFCLSLPVTQGRAIDEVAPAELLSASALGIDAAALVVVVLAALAVGSEYATGLIQQSLAVTPRRGRLLAAKVLALALAAAAIGVSAALAVGVVALGVGASAGAPAGAVFADGGVRLLAGSVLMPVFYGVLAVAAAFAFRSTALGIVAPLAVLVLSAIAGWFGSAVGAVVTPITPLAALHSISGIAVGAEAIGAPAGFLSLAVWTGAVLSIADSRFRRKDA
ncbi:hypothetical protein [Allonocardiopsis opalescens]|uniref:ABC-type transport system involved in multi-copper enzyme maturation permease subunit n=1 Tax=Allonocardiopsis opalescens TaxID=1144618 RepID=A0A2T0Q1P9_9ACTN|nr:hypothetical protein [Allonocardiopsis opalescens]PRX97725.1 ABC-type transport system involved in multi-copper enzyme maturation permease subunit [Allonocardiopsis opalescens]